MSSLDADLLTGAIFVAMERQHRELLVRRSEEKYRNILENIEDGYYEIDLTGRFTFFNDAVTGFSVMTGRPFYPWCIAT